ncbi:unnamed protein product [Echinostoma caproni]|uniref:Lig_chan-Glu_bd domain-containing protein n=1 Tax=Echinostoma caproni TaxID=27848 RepID=A0A183A513_9TREM|nr:unnamed protein product [Echinostoma caproni]
MDFITQVLLRMNKTNSTHSGVNITNYVVRSRREAPSLDLVRVKIQGFVFDVKSSRRDGKTSAAQHLRQLMKPFQHLLLDPQYTEHTITTYNPFVMQRQLDESQLAIRLEPLTWHVSHALVDFMHAYNWNLVILVYNTMVPGSTVLVEEMRKRRQERQAQDHSEMFEYDLNTLLYIADSLDNTEHSHLKALFDEGYVWIFTPSTMSSLTVADNQDKASADNNVLQEFTMFRRIPGMFGLVCLNDLERRKQSAELAREIWQKSMIELVYQLTQIYPPETPVQTNTLNAATLAYFRQILEKLRPDRLCHDSEHLTWQWGRRMYDIMRSLTFTFNNETISFLPNGGLNTSELYVYNSQISNGQMKWHKVGTWSMKSKWHRSKSRLRIDGVTWPGGANSPPKGRPSKFKLRVVTIKERPFVIYNRQQDDGTCDANSLPCRLRAQSIAHMDPPKQETGSLRTIGGGRILHPDFEDELSDDSLRQFGSTKAVDSNGTGLTENRTQYVNGCCTGLTMDLLMELMKDLNFDVDLFEVPDGLWGAWTPDGWNGLIRSLMDREADMAVTSLKITPNRSQQVEFSVPFLETGIAVTVALREGAISPTAFLKPYDYQCWCLILVFSVHASGAALFLFEWLSPNGLDRGRADMSGHRFSLFRSLWLIWSMLFGAAVNADNPRGVASRFLANIWALFALVFLASYTANLAAFMIAKEDYYDLSGMNDWRVSFRFSGYKMFAFCSVLEMKHCLPTRFGRILPPFSSSSYIAHSDFLRCTF